MAFGGAPTKYDDTVAFRGLVLSALWLIIRSLPKERLAVETAVNWRANAIGYMDGCGREGDEAKKYRRENTFPELRLRGNG